MITIHHNFDETKFKWLWAKYVKAGNIEKHCTASMIGQYSKKFSGSSNKDLLAQPKLRMDEVTDGNYEAIYFCGVLKKGYLHKDATKNNYRHNIHFAVRPVDGAHDVWDFENLTNGGRNSMSNPTRFEYSFTILSDTAATWEAFLNKHFCNLGYFHSLILPPWQ